MRTRKELADDLEAIINAWTRLHSQPMLLNAHAISIEEIALIVESLRSANNSFEGIDDSYEMCEGENHVSPHRGCYMR